MLEKVDGGDYRLTGDKSFVTNGGHADSYVVSTAALDRQAPGEFSCFVIPAAAIGLKFDEKPWAGLGMRGNSSRAARLDSVRVPADDRLGEEGDELWYVFRVVAPFFLVAMSGTYLGLAAAALDKAIAHLSRRRQAHTGQILGARDVLQHRLGELFAVVERTRAFVYSAAQRGDAGDEAALPVILSSKADVAEAAVHVANEVMTLVGGIGYAQDGDLGRILRDVRAAHVMAPTTDILRIWTGRALLGLPLLSE